jgi:nucleotide-binding universal stress UspA family protein
MMVVMAVVTTLATTPALALLYPPERFRAELAASATGGGVLAAVALPSSGPLLLDVATALADGAGAPVYVLHLERPPERGALGVGVAAGGSVDDALGPTLAHARARGIAVRPLQFVSRSPADDIRGVARAKGAGVVVMGWHKPVWSRTVLGGTVKAVMREADADVAVFVDRGLAWPPRRVLVPFAGTAQDRAAFRLAARIAARLDATITVLAVARPDGTPPGVDEVALPAAHDVRAVETASPVDAVVAEAVAHDLTVLGVGDGWHVEPTLFGLRSERLVAECASSLLVVRGRAERVGTAA